MKQPFPSSGRAGAAACAVGALAAAAALLAPPATAAPGAEADRGFSYFMGLARQQARYRETGSTLPFRSDARGASPMLVSGALYALNDQVLMSLDNETSFYPDRDSEVWHATAPSFNGTVLTDPVLQRNGFSVQQSRTQLLGQYRLRGPWFGVGGLALRTQSFKRFAFTPGTDNAVAVPTDATVEESVAELVFNAGIGLESEQVRGQASHYSLRALVGVPVWRRLTNSTAPLAVFDGTRGLDFGLEGRYSWALTDRIHAGGWASWSRLRRSAQTLGSTLEMPRSRLDSLGYGIELLWKL